VPLAGGGYARGVLSRTSGRGSAFGHFFGPRVMNPDDLDFADLDPRGAILVCMFGDHGLHRGKWPVVGKIENWDRKMWVIPKFVRDHDDPKLRYVTEYGDRLEFVSEREVVATRAELEGLPEDAQLGSGIVERTLSDLLSS